MSTQGGSTRPVGAIDIFGMLGRNAPVPTSSFLQQQPTVSLVAVAGIKYYLALRGSDAVITDQEIDKILIFR